MKHLIKIKEQNGKQVVSARELHKYLEVKERFSNWFKRQLQYGFEESTDYVGCKVFNTLANQELTDYVLTLDTAKEISMLQRTDKGKQARKYFIEVERKFNEGINEFLNDPIIQMRKVQIGHEHRITALEDIVTIEMKIDKQKLREQQAQLDKLWDIQDREDLY